MIPFDRDKKAFMNYRIKKVGLKMERPNNNESHPSFSVKIINKYNQVEKRKLFKNNLKKTVYSTDICSDTVFVLNNSTSQSLFWRLQLKYFIKFYNKYLDNIYQNELTFENYELKYKNFKINNQNEGVVMINKFDFKKGSKVEKVCKVNDKKVLEAFISRNPEGSVTLPENEKNEYLEAYYSGFIKFKDDIIQRYDLLTNTQKLKCLQQASRYMKTLSIEQSIFDVTALLGAADSKSSPSLSASTLTYKERWDIVNFIKQKAPTEVINLKGILVKYFVVDFFNMPNESLSA
jgi:hypothetical protein